MKPWQLLRWLNSAAVVVAFVVVPIALATRNGGSKYRRWGFVYLVCMTFATLSATVLAATTLNTFLTFIGRWQMAQGPMIFDWPVGCVFAAIMLGMLVYGGASTRR